MGRNVFVSYKYADSNVLRLASTPPNFTTIVRNYVDIIADKLRTNGDVYMGESNDNDLSDYSDDYIYEYLKDKIYPTTVTIVFISPNMKIEDRLDKSQWIPWEIYYSIYQANRHGRVSHTNAILAVVLPDRNGSYNYMIEDRRCCLSGCRMLSTYKLFTILKENIFNIKEPFKTQCNKGNYIYNGIHGYIPIVKWIDFLENMEFYIRMAESNRDNIEDFDMHRSVNKN